ncbi:hypothetical protein WISP_122102 [Willisornis vidua]|uniref:Uncharacterized protein n=1 Tax=Willisornis vidua TaxID=1566151 RepID=A0ABQ9CS97_9PASS|nr:hypothetical protein WISP_122102 [Willisornis vidua]
MHKPGAIQQGPGKLMEMHEPGKVLEELTEMHKPGTIQQGPGKLMEMHEPGKVLERLTDMHKPGTIRQRSWKSSWTCTSRVPSGKGPGKAHGDAQAGWHPVQFESPEMQTVALALKFAVTFWFSPWNFRNSSIMHMGTDQLNEFTDSVGINTDSVGINMAHGPSENKREFQIGEIGQ